MRCLMVTKEFSTTPTSGGTLRTLALLEQFAVGYETTVVSPGGVVRCGPGGVARHLPATPAAGPAARRHDLATWFEYRSISGVRTAGAALLANLAAGASGRYDVGVIDHTCIAGLADDVAVGCGRVVVSMHNIESDLMAQRAATAGRATRPAMRAETRLLRRIERHVAARFPVVVCTEADAAALGPATTVVARNGVFPPDPHPTAGLRARAGHPPSTIVFSGALDWEPNIDGLVWFADHVWPLVHARVPAAVVTVAGRNPGAAVVRACAAEGIVMLPDPPVMATVLAGHGLGIVPLLSGGGSRIKILEYLAAGLRIVSTDVGASGLDDVPATLIDRTPVDPVAFADRIVARLAEIAQGGPDAGRVVTAQTWVRENYSWPVTLRPLLEFLDR